MTTPSEPAPQPPPPPVTHWPAPEQTQAGPAPGVRFASHVPRIAAYIIDGLIIGVINFVVLFVGVAIVFGNLGPGDFQNGISSRMLGGMIGVFVIAFLVAGIVNIVYFPYFWASSGQTPGMRLFGLYVVRDLDGARISTGQAILRLIGTWVSAIPLYLGFIWIFFDVRRRGWHDLIAGTVVVERTQPD